MTFKPEPNLTRAAAQLLEGETGTAFIRIRDGFVQVGVLKGESFAECRLAKYDGAPLDKPLALQATELLHTIADKNAHGRTFDLSDNELVVRRTNEMWRIPVRKWLDPIPMPAEFTDVFQRTTADIATPISGLAPFASNQFGILFDFDSDGKCLQIVATDRKQFGCYSTKMWWNYLPMLLHEGSLLLIPKCVKYANKMMRVSRNETDKIAMFIAEPYTFYSNISDPNLFPAYKENLIGSESDKITFDLDISSMRKMLDMRLLNPTVSLIVGSDGFAAITDGRYIMLVKLNKLLPLGYHGVFKTDHLLNMMNMFGGSDVTCSVIKEDALMLRDPKRLIHGAVVPFKLPDDDPVKTAHYKFFKDYTKGK